MELKEATVAALDQALQLIKESPWEDSCMLRVERLRSQVDEPCVLAVAGRVKAGKSTLINALLGQDLSLTGVTETTATINYFRYGTPEDPQRPVKCVWRNGRSTWETRDFLDALQGTDETALQTAESIARLEFLLPHPDLLDITLVDTPGTDAIAGQDDDAHERTTKEFFGAPRGTQDGGQARRRRLQDAHSQETRKIAESADAVIYLVGQVAHVSNQDFLTEFQQASSGQTRALNAVGVMSKIDMFDEVIERRHELAAAIATKLSAELNTVVPVSAGLWRVLQGYKSDPSRPITLQNLLKEIPEERFSRMLVSDRSFLRDYPDCPVSVDARRAVLEGVPWRVFVIVARHLRTQSTDEAMLALQTISGFEDLRRLLTHHFFRRGQLLRCFRILSELYSILDGVRRSALHEYKQQLKRKHQELLAFTDFVVSHPMGKSDVANRLRRFLADNMPPDNAADLERVLSAALAQVEEARSNLESVNQQFLGLQLLEEAEVGVFTSEELKELRELFGMYAASDSSPGADARALAAKRQILWRQDQHRGRNTIRRAVAELAQLFYGRRLLTIAAKNEGATV